ncbi:thioredoxin-like protein, putative [Bodo saltans]|uniref:Thioredoxin-like protein, putative n=1 Tax=Bodo saltans TaxID=75058 RepID=A0A0S4IQ93_BODSA|nr:thioredoxin-like protein, putative [Bodo saltans]|eukprot:CUE71291.1 thioredoxin-like protein, putative [Bodo saltans]
MSARHQSTSKDASAAPVASPNVPTQFIGRLPDFQSTVQSSSPILVDFNTSWCLPCQRVAPEIEKLASTHSKVMFLKLNVEECEDVSALHDIRSVPTFLGFKDGHLIGRVEGAQLAAVERLLVQLEDPTPLPPDFPDPLE